MVIEAERKDIYLRSSDCNTKDSLIWSTIANSPVPMLTLPVVLLSSPAKLISPVMIPAKNNA